MRKFQLEELQADFCEFLQSGHHMSKIAEQLRPLSSDESLQRLGVYRNAYFIRLEKALAHDFPVTAKTLGEKVFAQEAGKYVLEHPSRHPSLRYAGHSFPSWLRTKSGVPVGDLAEIEWAVMRAFDGPDCDPTCADCLDGIPPDKWDRLHVALMPTLSVLELSSTADRVWLTKGEQTDLEQMPTHWIAVSRDTQFRPNLAKLDQGTFAVFNALLSEPCLATVSQGLAQSYDPKSVPEQVARALHIGFANNWVTEARVRDGESDAN